MFSQLAARKSIRKGLLPIAENSTPMQSFDPDQGNMMLVMRVTGRTAGNVTTALEGALTSAGPWVPLAAAAPFLPGQVQQSANGFAYIELFRISFPYLRVVSTPAGGFDGSIQTDLATDRMFDGPANS